MKQIVIIDHEPLTLRRQYVWHIDEMLQAGLQLAFWDASEYVHPGVPMADKVEAPYKQCCNSLADIKQRLDGTDIANTIFIVEVSMDWKTRALFRLLSDRCCFTIRVDWFGSVHLETSSFKGWRKLREAPLSMYVLKLKDVIPTLALRGYKYWYRIKGLNMVISSHDGPETSVFINHPDWEKFQNALANPQSPIVTEPYVVFIDEYYPLHPDYLCRFGKLPNANANAYQSSLCRFFDDYEKRTGLRVVIAAHPKAGYEPGTFGQRPIIKYQTDNLVQYAQGVFLHHSAAVAYAILFDKPVGFITNSEYKKNKHASYLQRKMADNFRCHLWDVDEDDKVLIHPGHVDGDLREYYIYHALTHRGIEREKTVDILINTFVTL